MRRWDFEEWVIFVLVVMAVVVLWAGLWFSFNSQNDNNDQVKALVVCPGESPVIVDQWKLDNGFIVVRINKKSVALPSVCGLMWPAD